jgi:5-bromo-4-chloroindolyl phosphate hydrolysis protein
MKLLLISAILLTSATQKEKPKVYICDNGKASKYHQTKTCRGLSNCSYKIVAIKLETAKKEGKTLCKWED